MKRALVLALLALSATAALARGTPPDSGDQPLTHSVNPAQRGVVAIPQANTKAILVITVVMPRDVPDIRRQIDKDSMDECWEDAKEFVAHGVPKQVDNAIAVMAGCLSFKQQEDEL